MSFEEFIIYFVELKTKRIERGETVELNEAMEWAISWFGSIGKAKNAYTGYLNGFFSSGCPLKINRITLSEETSLPVGCIHHSGVDCVDCWKICFDWLEEKRCVFWRLDNEV